MYLVCYGYGCKVSSNSYRPQGEGNVFRSVCLSTEGLYPEGLPHTWWRPPPPSRQTPGYWHLVAAIAAVGTHPLECILVYIIMYFCKRDSSRDSNSQFFLTKRQNIILTSWRDERLFSKSLHQTRLLKRIWSNVTLSKWQRVLLKTCHLVRLSDYRFWKSLTLGMI